MARIRIELPSTFIFSTTIPVRITDLNYGGHVGNDTILSIIHEARMQFLRTHGFDELNVSGVGLIMSDAAIEFKAEIFYGDAIIASVGIDGFTSVSFDFYYKLEKMSSDKLVTVAIAKTGMVCYDYARKKVAQVPADVRTILASPGSSS